MQRIYNRVLKIDPGAMNRAYSALSKIGKVWDETEEELAGLPDTAVIVGIEAFERAEARRADIISKRDAAINSAVAEINTAHAVYNEYLKSQCVPSAEHIAAARDDIEIIKLGAVAGIEELAAIEERNIDNPAVLSMCSEYAKSRSWSGFDLFDNRKACADFGDTFFEACTSAVYAPTGASYWGMLLTTEGAVAEMAAEHGISMEYEKSTSENQ